MLLGEWEVLEETATAIGPVSKQALSRMGTPTEEAPGSVGKAPVRSVHLDGTRFRSGP